MVAKPDTLGSSDRLETSTETSNKPRIVVTATEAEKARLIAYLRHHSIRRAAADLGCSEGTVRNTLRRLSPTLTAFINSLPSDTASLRS